MLHFRPGSQVHRLVTLLSVVGEFPARSIHLLGNKRVYMELIRKLTEPQIFRHYQTGTDFSCRLLTISGKGRDKTIRLYKGALPILNWIHPKSYEYYMDAFWNHRFPGDAAHKERNHRVAEMAAMCMNAELEFRPYMLPNLQNQELLHLVPNEPVFYLAKELKKTGGNEMNKTMFTRMVGALFSGNTGYAAYNTREAVMKWSGMGEFKALHHLVELGRLNAGISRIDSAILLGDSDSVALKTLLESDKSHRLEFRFDSIYQHIHFIPMNEFGARMLKLLAIPDWNEILLDLLFEPEDRSYNKGSFEYDACVNGVFVFSHLDGDIARLIRFREALRSQTVKTEILCYPHQVPFLREYLGQAELKTIGIDSVEDAIGPERRL